jgi:hypothetical protein
MTLVQIAILWEGHNLPIEKSDQSSILSMFKDPRYKILALFLLVVESLLGAWLALAESMIERIVAGILMILIFAMFFIVLLKGTRLTTIRLKLFFPQPNKKAYPSKLAHFNEARCFCTIFSNGTEVERDKEVEILTAKKIDGSGVIPYIVVNDPGKPNPAFRIRLEYKGHNWLSDDYAPMEGMVNLQ